MSLSVDDLRLIGAELFILPSARDLLGSASKSGTSAATGVTSDGGETHKGLAGGSSKSNATSDAHSFTFSALASGKAPPSCPRLLIDATNARVVNADQETPPEYEAVFEDGFSKCLCALGEAGVFGPAKPPTLLFLHPPVYTCEQAEKYVPATFGGCGDAPRGPYAEMKNLLVRDKKKRLYLISAAVSTEIKLNGLKLEGMASGGLGFASNEVLWETLQLLPGSVTPFGLIQDTAGKITYYLDENALQRGYLGFHPNACNGTLVIHHTVFIEFIESFTHHKVNMLRS